MKITSISRKISGDNYDNFSASAEIEDNEDVAKAMVDLDKKLQDAMDKVYDANQRQKEHNAEVQEAVSVLEDAIFWAKKQREELPF